MVARASPVRPRLDNPGWLARCMRSAARIVAVLLLSLVSAIVLQWIGLSAWWPEQGAQHSARMLDEELRYLNRDFRSSLFLARPPELAERAAAAVRRAGRAGHVERVGAWIEDAIYSLAGEDMEVVGSFRRALNSYLTTAGNTTQTFAARLVVLAFGTPAFALFGVVGLVEGLVRRDLRRWGGGRETSFLYHHGKKLLGPSILSCWVLYLILPVSVHPTLVLLPFAALFAFNVAVVTGTFKKYL